MCLRASISDSTSTVFGAGGLPAAKIVPVSCAIVGVEDADSVTVIARGGPNEKVWGDTFFQAEPLHQWRLVAPFRLVSTIVSDVKLLPGATCTSKYSPDDWKA